MEDLIYNEGEATSYHLLEEIRSGQEGRTWRARQVGPDGRSLPVAVKVLTRDSWLGLEADPEEVLRKWRGQTHVMRNFGHRGFAPVQVAFPIRAHPQHPSATPSWMLGVPAFVMGWIDGLTLGEWSATVASPLERLTVLEVCASGLDEFHRATGHVHRDLKPSNIMVENDIARIVDYGLIRSVDRLRSRSGLEGSTPYIDPALFSGEEYSAMTDLFSFAGIIAYQLTLAHPIPGRLAPEVQGDLIRAGVGDGVARVVAYSLSPKREDRPPVDGAAHLLRHVIDRLAQGSAPAPDWRGPRPRSPSNAPSIATAPVTAPATTTTAAATSLPSPTAHGEEIRRVVLVKIIAPVLVAIVLTLTAVLLIRALHA